MQLAQFEDSQKTLQRPGFTGSINTAFFERINFTLRQGVAALTRRSWATAQLSQELEARLEWWRAWYHFCRPRQGFRLKVDTLKARKAHQIVRRDQERTPAIAADLTHRV